MFREDVTVSDVVEETRHFWQNKHRLNDDKSWNLRELLNEIEAKEYLIKEQKKFNIPRAETLQTMKQLEGYRKQLEDFILQEAKP